MKNLKFILLFAISIVMLSCGNDDDSSSPDLTTADLAGTYNFNFFESTTVASLMTDLGTIVSTTETEGDTFTDSNIVFNADGTYATDIQYRIISTTTSTLEGSETIVEEEIITESNTGTYTVNDDDQTITFDGEETSDITRFDGDELRIESTFSSTLSEGTITIDSELRFTRQ